MPVELCGGDRVLCAGLPSLSEGVGENIAFGLEKLRSEQVREAAAIASLDGEVQDLRPVQTMVGERGVTLSADRNSGRDCAA